MHITIAIENPTSPTIIPFFTHGDPLDLQVEFKDLSSLVTRQMGKLKKGQTFTVTSEGRLYILLSLGEKPAFLDILMSLRKFMKQQQPLLEEEINLKLDAFKNNDWSPAWIEAAINGIYWSTYQLKVDSDAKAPQLQSVLVQCPDIEANKMAINHGVHIAQSQIGAAVLVNTPSNIKHPEYMGAWAIKSGKEHNLKVEVFDLARIRNEGLHALYEVGKASAFEPTFIKTIYEPVEYTHTLGLVGKGITFDTGGLSIKPSANLHYMKCDMGGAAAVLGGIEAIARLQLPIRVIAIVPCAENAVNGNAYRPGDVIQSHSGKTIEIIDTDAEGRLILADGLSYLLQNYKPDTLLDLATLTGSTVATLGYEAAAIFSNNDDLVNLVALAGDEVGERVWRLPLWDAYKDDISSDVADLRNYSGKPLAGAITSAKFLEAFTQDHPRWAHLDIAGVAFKESEFGKMKNATAYGVRLLVEIAKALTTK